jgi:hypothetical protein
LAAEMLAGQCFRCFDMFLLGHRSVAFGGDRMKYRLLDLAAIRPLESFA